MSNFYKRGAALMNNRIYTIQEVANILGVSTKTLRRWDQRGRFVPTRTAGNQRRYTQEQIQKFKIQNSKVKIKNGTGVEEPFFKPEAPIEKKPTHGLPSIFRNLPSTSFLRQHFLLRSKEEFPLGDKLVESSSFQESGVKFLQDSESPAKKVSALQVGMIFAVLILILSSAGAIAMAKYNLIGNLVQKKRTICQVRGKSSPNWY